MAHHQLCIIITINVDEEVRTDRERILYIYILEEFEQGTKTAGGAVPYNHL